MLTKKETEIIKIATKPIKLEISFPKYYEKDGKLIKENQNGSKHIVKFDDNGKEIILEDL